MVYGYYDRNGKNLLISAEAPTDAVNPITEENEEYPENIKDVQYNLRTLME